MSGGDGEKKPLPASSAAERRTDILSTYRHLRLAMVLLLLMLMVSVVDASYRDKGWCFEGSISAYYFTPARAVFICVLCALGACLIVYRGKTNHEDVALNISGALAFVVAFVPTSPPTSDRLECTTHHIADVGQLAQGIDNNIRAYVAVATVSLAISFALTGGRVRSEVPSGVGTTKTRNVQAVGQWLLVVLLAVGTAAFWAWPERFRDRAHSLAAVLMFVGILFVVFFNARRISHPTSVGAPSRAPRPPPDVTGRRRSLFISSDSAGTIYRWLARVMAVSIALTLVLHLTLDQWRYSILVIEAVLLLEFLVFWVVQTSELWFDDAEPPPPTPPPTPPTAA